MGIIMEQQVVRRHGGLGIASFVITLISLIAIVMLFLIIGVMVNQGRVPEKDPLIQIMSLGVILAAFVDLIGVGLGIAGAMDRTSKKVFPVLGLILGIAILVIAGALMVIGLLAKH
jgi:hypothetical protein